MDEHLKETRVDGELAYDGSFLKVQRDTVSLPDGKHTIREYIRHPGAVVILPLFDDGSVLLERQYRYPPDQVFINSPQERSICMNRRWPVQSANCSKKPVIPQPIGNSFAPSIMRLPIPTSTWKFTSLVD
jgi:hypothetical protein